MDVENGIPFFTPLFIRTPKVLLIHHIHKNVFFQELPKWVAWLPYILEVYIMPFVYNNILSKSIPYEDFTRITHKIRSIRSGTIL